MSTTMVRKEDVVRKWYFLDAAGKPLGKTAALAADLLRGKRKVDYTPHVDCGDFVIIINAKDDRLMATRPTLAMTLAVRGMLAKNPTQKWQLRRLKVFAGNEHKHAAQKPEVWTVE